jgi:hypothetical protein
MRPVVLAGTLVVVGLFGFAVGSCNDQTRYVVAEAPAAPAAEEEATGPVSPEDEAAIAELLQVAVSTDPDVPWSEREPLIEGGEDLESTTDAVMELIAGIGDVQLEVVGITGEDDEAVATVDVIVEGAAFAEGIPVALVRVDGEWKVTRDGACAVLAVGSPCPDAPA